LSAWLRAPAALGAAGLLIGAGAPAQAQTPPAAAPRAETLVVTATRTEMPAFELPASIDRIDGEAIRDGRLQVNLSESLAGVSGLQIKDRQNFAQDLQLSVRGFGARASFGIRGVRVYVDGIPATLPDGQGQLSNIDLGSVDRIEVLRGPFSALYGNSSGGVLQVFTEDGQGPPTLTLSGAAGSSGVWRAGLKLSGRDEAFSYVLSSSAFATDGSREHSAARRRVANAKLGWQLGADTRIGLVGNAVALPLAQDPLGLTRAQFKADPRAADAAALNFDTRKTFDQSQLGLTVDHRLNANHALQLLLYGGQRETEQFQAIPVATQANALHPGGVIQLERRYAGADLRWRISGTLAGGPSSLVLGVARDGLDEQRRGRQNFSGATLGVEGALRRDEDNHVTSLDGYAQASWRPLAALQLNAGLRTSRVRFRSTDHYIVGANPDDSGAVAFSAANPVLGASWALSEGLRVYATVGRGFETPTLNELAYRADGQTGLNLGLRAARSRNAELGLKGRLGAWGEWSLAGFEVRTRGEIVTLGNVGGRATFTNAGSTRRQGAEAAWRARTLGDLELALAYAYLDARYRQDFLTCAATPCPQPTLRIPAGNRIPGVAASTAAFSAGWEPERGWRAALELRASGRVPVNDANSDAAAGYAVVNLQAGYLGRWAGGRWSVFARVDNVMDRTYAGSVIVNEGNGRFFEAAPGRNWLLGGQLVTTF